jgi:four helix bundle protein
MTPRHKEVGMQRKGVHSHEDLEVWKLARTLAADTYRMTAQLPIEERFGLQSQMRRAAVSVLSNLAEGAARDSRADFCRFLAVSMGSLAELDIQCSLCEELGFMKRDESFLRKIRAVRIMLAGLRRALLPVERRR